MTHESYESPEVVEARLRKALEDVMILREAPYHFKAGCEYILSNFKDDKLPAVLVSLVSIVMIENLRLKREVEQLHKAHVIVTDLLLDKS